MLGIMEKPYSTRRYERGLSTAAAYELQKEYGTNTLAPPKRAGGFKIFIGQFKDVMVMILVIATAISAFLGEYYDAVTIAAIVLLNAFLGFIQEFRTEKTMQALKNMTAPSAKVYRDGELVSIPAAEIVPGDVITLEAGDKVPADCVLLSQKGLHADESILTGEPVSVIKEIGDTADKDNRIGKSNIVYSGTVITKGIGEARVIATGLNAQVGKISDMLTSISDEMTPLQKRLSELGKTVALICIFVCVVVAGAGILRGEPVFDMALTGITIAIAAIPEGLPATVTIVLALAVGRMMKKNALVTSLHAVETLGCTSVICTDKTGTVTENKMTVAKIFCDGKTYDVSGGGYRISGEYSLDGGRVNPLSDISLQELLKCSVFCNNASIYTKHDIGTRERGKITSGGSWEAVGDPTEISLLIAAAKGGVLAGNFKNTHFKTDEIPFDSANRCMTVIIRENKTKTAYTKGSLDVILRKCSFILTPQGVVPLTPRMKQKINGINEKLTASALRVLAFSKKNVNDISESECGMVFLGLMGMSDPPRPEAKRAVKLCRSARVKTVMITGDHENTAAAVAKEAGIMRGGDMLITGTNLERMSDNQLDDVISKTTVFARVSPADKLRIVRAFKRTGAVVTMTGDGVNDAPAVKEASIGVAMGITGTDVTKQAADVVLLDDNFATLVSAVEQGRGIYANIRKFVRYMLSCNIGEVLTMFLGIIMGLPMVLLPTQILLVNLVTDGLPAIALGLEPPDPENMKKPPRKSDESFFSEGLLLKIIFRGILIGVCTLGSFVLIATMSGNLHAARTGALFTLVMSQLIHVFECKSETRNIFTVKYFSNPKLILAVIISLAVIFSAIYLPFLQVIFATVPLTLNQAMVALGFAIFAPLLQCMYNS